MFSFKRLLFGRSPQGSPAAPEATPVAVMESRPAVAGLVEQRSVRHVAGWMFDPARPGEPPEFDVVLADGSVVANGRADLGLAWLRQPPAAGHGFHLVLPRRPSDAERAGAEVRPAGGGRALPLAADPIEQYRPIKHVALDIVDNCNLRCPFCLYDYANTHRTNVMTDEVFEAAIRLMPYVGNEFFWLSCLHEPTMHPKFTSFIERIPQEFRSNIFYTTNLSRRMPQEYYDALSRSGLAFINISIESRDPELYERMRKGAKHRIFMESWEKLLAACAAGPAPPKLRYIMMVYKSNLREIPHLIEYLRSERMASFIDVRYTFNMAHIEDEFRAAEFLDPEEWHWLAAQLAHYPPHEVSLSLPPDLPPDLPPAHPDATPAAGAAPAEAATVVAEMASPVPSRPQFVTSPGEFEFRVSWDGRAFVAPIYIGPRPDIVPDLAEINIRDLTDPADFLGKLRAA